MLRFLQNAGAVIWAILAVPFLLFGMIFKPGDFLPVGGFWKFLLGIVLALFVLGFAVLGLAIWMACK